MQQHKGPVTDTHDRARTQTHNMQVHTTTQRKDTHDRLSVGLSVGGVVTVGEEGRVGPLGPSGRRYQAMPA